MRQRPRRNRNGGILRSVSLSLSLSLSLSDSPRGPTGLQPHRSLPLVSHSQVSTHPVRRANPPYPPTLALMHYETRNDESACVSHVMEIPLLIRALNDSPTAGRITGIITSAETCTSPLFSLTLSSSFSLSLSFPRSGALLLTGEEQWIARRSATKTVSVLTYDPVARGLSSCSTTRINDHAR